MLDQRLQAAFTVAFIHFDYQWTFTVSKSTGNLLQAYPMLISHRFTNSATHSRFQEVCKSFLVNMVTRNV